MACSTSLDKPRQDALCVAARRRDVTLSVIGTVARDDAC
jgi:hypothetical protein